MRSTIKKLERARRILSRATPLDTDCGRLCGARCCEGDDTQGMALLPGEALLCRDIPGFSIRQASDGTEHPVLICTGQCDRNTRPLACRIFPLFPLPIPHRKRRVEAITDLRALSMCPLLRDSAPDITPTFRRAVKKAGRTLMSDRRIRRQLRDTGLYLTELAVLHAQIYGDNTCAES